MKIEFNKEKGSELITGIVKNTVDLGKKAVADAKVGVAAMVEKNKDSEYARRMKKYNPLFPDQYKSESFKIPNIIVIVDDAVRRGIDVCEGAIGWLSKESGEEVLHLYDEAIQFSGVHFIPAPICNTVYCVDHFDRNRFVQADEIFKRTNREKADELVHIAECIGAKRCIVDISEDAKSTETQEKAAEVGADIGKEKRKVSAESKMSNKNSKSQNEHRDIKFTGLRFPKRPTVKWFAYDDGLNHLIDSCCSGKRRVKEMTFKFSGSASATMSNSTACAIDGVIGKSISIKGNASMKKQAKTESNQKFYFYIEF